MKPAAPASRRDRIRTIAHARGFSLLEVLVAIVVLGIGLLGMAALQAFSLKANQSASFRTRATALAYRIVEEMRAHGGGALNTAVAYYGTGGDTRATEDLQKWNAAIANELPDGVGNIDFPGGKVKVTITWTDARWSISTPQGQFFYETTL